MKKNRKLLVTGGAGYVGAVLIPKLLKKGYHVKVLDLFLFGDHVLDECKNHLNLEIIKGDIRDRELLFDSVSGCDTVIHLACISNDPSYELNPELSKTINYDAFIDLVKIAKEKRIKNFIYASSSSVYGIKNDSEVTEDMVLEPLTDYSKYKALCEEILLKNSSDEFIPTIIRPSTVCGYSPRLRLDLTVNILTNHAINNKKIKVFGGEQMRPNIHIEDMCELYMFLLEQPDYKINKKIYNAGYQNYKVKDIAEIVRKAIDPAIEIETIPTDDNRSYHVSSKKIEKELGFIAKHSIEKAVMDLKDAFDSGKINNPMENIRYYNIKTMQALNFK